MLIIFIVVLLLGLDGSWVRILNKYRMKQEWVAGLIGTEDKIGQAV
jgi:hypothetical protein